MPADHMGLRHPDRTDMAVWRNGAPTVGVMRERGWDVLSKCGVCHLFMHVDLAVIIAVSGPDVSLWNRQAPCRRIGCEGRVTFLGRPPRATLHRPLR